MKNSVDTINKAIEVVNSENDTLLKVVENAIKKKTQRRIDDYLDHKNVRLAD